MGGCVSRNILELGKNGCLLNPSSSLLGKPPMCLPSYTDFLKNLYIYTYLVLAALCVHCCFRACSACGERGFSAWQHAGLSFQWVLLQWNTAPELVGSAVVVCGLSCPELCGIFPDQWLNPRPLHWQVSSLPLVHQGSPTLSLVVWGLFLLFFS